MNPSIFQLFIGVDTYLIRQNAGRTAAGRGYRRDVRAQSEKGWDGDQARRRRRLLLCDRNWCLQRPHQHRRRTEDCLQVVYQRNKWSALETLYCVDHINLCKGQDIVFIPSTTTDCLYLCFQLWRRGQLWRACAALQHASGRLNTGAAAAVPWTTFSWILSGKSEI